MLFSKNNKDGEEYETKMKARYLNDTRYATRIFAKSASFLYDETNRGKIKESKRRVFARPGGVTASLRRVWGVENYKKDKQKKRLDDSRHHALDALIVACCDEAMLQKITKHFQENERNGLRALKGTKEPWEGFREDLKEKYEQIITARPANHRARGETHGATIKSAVFQGDGGVVVYESKQLEGVKPAEVRKLLDKIKDPERNDHIIKALVKWRENDCKGLPTIEKKPKREGSNQPVIIDTLRKITIKSEKNPGVLLSHKRESGSKNRCGVVSRGSMTRVDVYSQLNQKGENKGKKSYYLVPIYSYQIMNKRKYPIPPMLAIVSGKDEKDWQRIDKSFSFEFSIYPKTYVKIQKKGESIKEGYYASTDRSSGKMTVRKKNASASQKEKKDNKEKKKDNNFTAGPRNLLIFEKYQINRFGEKFPVKESKITWHGQAKTLEEWLDEAEKYKNNDVKDQE